MEISKEEEQRYVELQKIALDFARAGETKELEKMIKHGLSSNLLTQKDDSLLMLATYNGNLETSKMLLENGANIDQANQRGQTPLEGVCFKGSLDIVKLLVENGAKISNSSLVYASIFGHKEIFEYLKKQSKAENKRSFLSIGMWFIVSIASKIKKIYKSLKALV